MEKWTLSRWSLLPVSSQTEYYFLESATKIRLLSKEEVARPPKLDDTPTDANVRLRPDPSCLPLGGCFRSFHSTMLPLYLVVCFSIVERSECVDDIQFGNDGRREGPKGRRHSPLHARPECLWWYVYIVIAFSFAYLLMIYAYSADSPMNAFVRNRQRWWSCVHRR